MLLVELEINGVTNYLSQEGIALTHYWDSHILSFDAPQYNMDKKYGGYARPSFGSISLTQELFKNDWVPPTASQVAIRYTSTDEESATTLFSGTAYLKSINREGIRYDLYGGVIGSGGSIASGTSFENVALGYVFSQGATTLGLSLDTSLAKSNSTDIEYTMQGDQEITTFLSDLAASFNHMYYVKQDTIYLVDMFVDNGTTTITEFSYFPSTYEFNPPSTIVSGVSRSGITYPYGNEVSVKSFVRSEVSMSITLNDIWETWHKPIFNLKIPFINPLPVTPGMRIQWIDNAQQNSVSGYIRVRNVRYDFDNEEVTLTGEGEIESG
uniref:Uncharacterized protein n=1 Tax=viral metagenome TaxID=1070528 RepID=A0A6M3IP22_9ZZZZ